MRLRNLALIITMMILPFGPAFGQSLSLDHADGLLDATHLDTGVPVTFYIRVTGDGDSHGGITNGFRVYSEDGAVWNPLVGGLTGTLGPDQFDLIFIINPSGITGSGADTVGFGGAKLFGTGLPVGFDDVAYTLDIGPIAESELGKTICLDSSYYPPSGVWKWAGPDVYPAWDGPHCYLIGPGPPPPSIECPEEPLVASACVGDQICVALAITGSETVTVEGATWSDGQLCFTAVSAGPMQFHVEATNAGGTTTCDLTVDVTIDPLPVITCPEGPIVVVNLATTICDGLPISDADNVTVTSDNEAYTATWAENQICFNADIDGSFTATVIATNACGADTCSILIEVGEQPTVPVIDCPTEPLAVDGCWGEEVCVPLAITDAETVTVDNGATWVDGQLCFPTGPEKSLYNFHVEATNQLGTTTCDLTVNVTDGFPPEITCPEGPIDEIFCAAPALICLPITVDNASLVVPSFGTYEAGNLCFFADTTGQYIIDITATGACGEDNCTVVFNVSIGSRPEIACPADPNLIVDSTDIPVCEELVITGAETVEVLVDNPDYEVNWINDEVCFNADVVGSFTATFIATNSCGADTCEVFVTVLPPPCIDMSLSQTEFVFNMTTADGVNPDAQTLIVLSEDPPFSFEIIPGMASWLTIDPLTGTAEDPVSISVDGLALDAGTYDVECAVIGNPEVVCEPNTQYFTVTLNVSIPPSEDDVIYIPTVPAVLGARVAVPITMEFLCDLAELDVWLEYTTNELVTLDSVSFANSLIEEWAAKNVALGAGNLNLTAAVSAGENLITAGTGILMTMHFNVQGNAAPGFYPINGITPDPIFTYDCGEGPASVVPTIINGGIVIGTSENYVCGYVVDPNGHSIEGATVELWPDFPYGAWDDQTHSDASGLFEFFDSDIIPFDVYAYKEGYYPGKVENINFAQTGIMIVLTPVQPVTPTLEWVNFYCETNLYMGAPLPVGSVIDAFDPDGVHCGSWFVSEAGRYGFMPIYRDDPYTTEDEGADPDDNIRLYVNGVQAYTPDLTVWTANGDIHQVCLDVGDIIVKTCDLFEGWNLVSWNVDTEGDDIMEVLASIDPCLEVVLGFEGEGLTYDPNLPMFSNLKFVDHLSGYWIKVSCDITLEIAGEAVPVTTGIPVINGWNLVSYLPDYNLPTEDALASVHDDLIVALGWDPSIGNLVYQPGDILHNDLLEMGPCNGYWLKNDFPGVLTYPGAGPKIAPQPNRHIIAAKGLLDGMIATNTWMNVYAQRLTLDGATVKAGAQVTAHNEDGLMIGRFVIEQDGLFGFMAVYGDDQTTDAIDGARQGEAFSLRIDGVETHETYTFSGATGSRMEVGALTAKGNSDGSLPTKYSLGQNYPNPFNPKTTISFVMPSTGKAMIEVYNVLGRLVSTPFDGIAQSGLNEVVWDGTNTTGEAVASGIYFYRLKTESFTETKKMTLLK